MRRSSGDEDRRVYQQKLFNFPLQCPRTLARRDCLIDTAIEKVKGWSSDVWRSLTRKSQDFEFTELRFKSQSIDFDQFPFLTCLKLKLKTLLPLIDNHTSVGSSYSYNYTRNYQFFEVNVRNMQNNVTTSYASNTSDKTKSEIRTVKFVIGLFLFSQF